MTKKTCTAGSAAPCFNAKPSMVLHGEIIPQKLAKLSAAKPAKKAPAKAGRK